MSSIQDILQIITSIFECVKKENDDMILNIEDLSENTYTLTFDLKEDISTLQKKVVSLNLEFDYIVVFKNNIFIFIYKHSEVIYRYTVPTVVSP